MKIWVAAAPHSDPRLAGKARVRKPWQRDRFFTEVPTEVKKTSDVIRMLIRGDLVEVGEPVLHQAVVVYAAPFPPDPAPEDQTFEVVTVSDSTGDEE